MLRTKIKLTVTQIERLEKRKTKEVLHTDLIMSVLMVQRQKNNTSPFRCTRLSFMGSKITKIGVTNDKISGRGGLSFYLRYIKNIGLYRLIFNTLISFLFVSSKGLQLQQFLKQIFAFLWMGQTCQ